MIFPILSHIIYPILYPILCPINNPQGIPNISAVSSTKVCRALLSTARVAAPKPVFLGGVDL